MDNNVAVVVLTLNAGEAWRDWIVAYNSQEKMTVCHSIDSSSSDGTPTLSAESGLNVLTIERGSFNHGATRDDALKLCGEFEFIIFMTQDAILADSGSIQRILQPFEDIAVGAVCGRQLPRAGAGAIESHARLFNYPPVSRVCALEHVQRLGLKTAFLSNSFAAYRVSALSEVGGFPGDVIFGEDMYVAAKMLLAGYKIAYESDACVYHSHNYSLGQEMRRYFDMGVFHARESWIRENLGGAEGEGVKFVISEFEYLLKNSFWRIPEGMLRILFRYTGFRFGLLEKWLPQWLKRRLAMNKGYFKE